MTQLPGVSVIIPVLNGQRSIAKCVESVLASRFAREDMEVICIDNGSVDGTPAILREFQPAITVLHEPKPGPACARNAGLRAATRELVAFTDADCFVGQDWLSNILEPLRGDRTGAVGGRILARPEAGPVERFGELIHDHARAIESDRPPYIIGMNMASRVSLLRSIGMFGERWGRLEDCDIAYRILRAGVQLAYRHDAVIYHHNRDTLAALAREGFLHGYFLPAFLRVHGHFILDYQRRLAKEPLREPSYKPQPRIESWRTKLCWKVFRSGKRAGVLAGRWFPPPIEMTTPADPAESVTILMPCKDQKQEYFMDAVQSVVRQTSPRWVLLVLTDPASPEELNDWAASFSDPRIQVIRCPHNGFAQALNHGLQTALSPFVSILLSDDRYAPDAVSTLLAYRERFPLVDFFHSARRHIDRKGQIWGPVMPSRTGFNLDYFQTRGSPVKHLLCWRRELALTIGGMDEAVFPHGCDDYDFPWRMAESGARFHAVEECLYEYRLHHEHGRLTTTVPVTRQMDVLRAIFERHNVGPRRTDRFLQRARDNYLIAEFTDQIDRHRGLQLFVRCFREADTGSLERFLKAGFEQRNWFPHRIYVLPKGGPDGLKLADRMAGCREPSRMREFLLYALPSVTAEFPREIFYDDDLQWHQQQFGIDGQIACANVVIEEGGLRCYLLISDIVQRISRAPHHRTRIDNRFHGWSRLLLNAVMDYAAENSIPAVYVTGSELMLRNTDRRRNPKPPLYQRIYDDVPRQLGAVRKGDWWRLDVNALKDRIVPLARRYEADAWPKTVCILHDIERGMGHLETDPEFARLVDTPSQEALLRMLEIEARCGVRATYSIVGQLLPQLSEDTRDMMRRDGHALAFHSYDHRIASRPAAAVEQFHQCRVLDYRLKGYRLPQSKLTPGLTDAHFAEWNFEWLASSCTSLGTEVPLMSNGVVKIPVHIDDYKMFRHAVSYESWQREVLEMADARDFLVIGLHDCYARFWLSQYENLLRELQARATLITLDEVAARVTLGQSRWFEQE